MAAVVARGLGGGFRSAFPMVLGLVLGDLVFLSCATFGLAALAQQFSTVFLAVKWAGAAYLLYLAVKLWMALRARTTSGPPRHRASSGPCSRASR